jgi:hypothetical protein
MPLGAMRLSRIDSGDAESPKGILGRRDDLEMLGIDAGWVAAKMVDGHPLRDWTNPEFVSDTMRPRVTLAKVELAVALVVQRPFPIPAFARR